MELIDWVIGDLYLGEFANRHLSLVICHCHFTNSDHLDMVLVPRTYSMTANAINNRQ
jgi:hypothetical protein